MIDLCCVLFSYVVVFLSSWTKKKRKEKEKEKKFSFSFNVSIKWTA